MLPFDMLLYSDVLVFDRLVLLELCSKLESRTARKLLLFDDERLSPSDVDEEIFLRFLEAVEA